MIQLLSYLFGEVLDGRDAHVTDGVQHGLGRERSEWTALNHIRTAAGLGAAAAFTAASHVG